MAQSYNKFIIPIFFTLAFFTFIKISFAEPLPLFTPQMVSQIQYGKSSKPTKDLQITLNSLGYTVAKEGPGSEGKETERYDANLKKAIKEFQIENDLKVTEKLDVPTVKVLNELITFINENSEEADVISSTYTTDIDDTYGQDPDLNKDFFADGESLNFFDKDTRDALSYVGNALKSYSDINITGVQGINGENSILANRKDTQNTTPKALTPLEEKAKSVNTGNIFQDTMIRTILGNASVLFYQTFIAGPLKALTPINPRPTSESSSERVKDFSEFYTDGKFDLIKCYSDPICVNL